MRISRFVIVAVACGALLYAQSSGVHVHVMTGELETSHHDSAPAHDHGTHVVNAHDADHSFGHADHDAMDLDVTGQALGKASSLTALVALFAAAALLLSFARPAPLPRPRTRRLAVRRRIPYLLPPSQAPPIAG